MRQTRWAAFVAVLCLACVIMPKRLSAQGVTAMPESPAAKLTKLPFAFEPTTGRIAEPDTYLTRSGPVQVSFSTAGFQIAPTSGTSGFSLDARLVAANPKTAILASDRTGGESNYLLGADSSRWKTHVPQFGRLRYREVYPGIDLVFYGNNGQLEHDFIVQPGADYHAIRLRYQGQRCMHLTPHGDLEIAVGSGVVTVHAPRVYQEREGQQIARGGRFVLRQHGNRSEVSFAVPGYDRTLPLIIDPVLDYATYLADQNLSVGAVAVDAGGNTYIVGSSAGVNYPVTNGALQTTCPACAANESAIFITKLNATGTAQVYSTFFGGSNANEGDGIAVDASGNAVIVGRTNSTDFPLKNPVAAGSPSGEYDGFISSIAPDGASLNFSSRLGGASSGNQNPNTYVIAVATDTNGNAYVSGQTESSMIPQTAGALNAGMPSYSNDYYFLTKLTASGSLVYGAIPGASGSASECCTVAGIHVDGQGNVFLGGTVGSNDLTPATTPWPTTPGAYQSQPITAGSPSPFAAKISPDGSTLIYSTLAGAGVVRGMAVDAAGEMVLVGAAATGTPTTSDAFDTLPSQSFMAKVSADGAQLLYSSYFGISQPGQALGNLYLTNVALDGAGNVWLAGNDGSGNNVPLVHPIQSLPGAFGTQPGTAFVSEFDAALHTLLFSTYFNGNLGGSIASGLAVDTQGRTHFVGTGVDDLPTTSSAFLGSVTPPPSGYSYQYGFAALIDPAAAGPGICFSGDIYPVAALGSSMQGSLTVTDCGTAPLTISQVQVAGPGFTLPSPSACAVTIAPAQSCSFPLVFTPSVAESTYGSLTFSSNAPVAQTILPIDGNGIVAAGPAVVLSARSEDFGSVEVGSTSNQKMVNVMNVGKDSLTISSVTVSGDFQQTNNCNTTVFENGDCTINLTFTPTAGGMRTGTLAITSNAPGSPQIVPLTGVGASALTVASTSPTLTVSSAGQSATTMIQLSSQGGFTGTASLSCAVQFMGQGTANNPPTCSLNPAQVQVSSSGSVSSSLTVTTTSSTSSPAARRAGLYWFLGAMFLLGFAPRRRLFAAMAVCLVFLTCGTAVVMIGCGGNTTRITPTPIPAPVASAGTTSGLYNVIVTATSGNVTSSTTLPLNVQ